MCSYAKKLALFLNEMNLITCYGSPCKSGQTDKLVRNIYSSIIKSPTPHVNKETQTHLRFSWHGTLFDEFKRISNDGMFRCYGLFRHVVGTMTLEDPNRFKTPRSFVLGAHVVKLQCKQSASVLSQSQTLMTNVFFLSMTTPPPLQK